MRLGYIFSRYPLLSETFILRELLALQRMGFALTICPLRAVAGPRHDRAAAMEPHIFIAPWVTRDMLRLHARWLRRDPRRYWTTWASALWQNRGDANLLAGALAYWGKAVVIADHFVAAGVQHVHAHFATHPALVAWMVHRLTGLPYSFSVHAHDLYCHRAMLATKLRAARFAVPISRLNQRLLAELQAEALVPTPLPVIHCGVESERYPPRRHETEGDAGTRPLRALAIGSLEAYKGHRVLLEALRLIGPRWECRIGGGGRLRRRLQRRARRLGIADRVTWRGPLTEAQVARELQWADVFVMPSIRLRSGRTEGIPVALMEAMAAGLPVVASRISGIPELVRDGVDGLLTPPRDAYAIADALYLLGDAGQRRAMGAAGRNRVRREFSLQAGAELLAAQFRAVRTPASMPPRTQGTRS